MGAEVIHKRYDGEMSGAQVKAAIIDHIQNEKRAMRSSRDYEGYSGGWGEVEAACNIHDKVMENEDAASDFLDQQAEKWGAAEAVKYRKSIRLNAEQTKKFEEDKKVAFEGSKKIIKAGEVFQTAADKFEKIAKEMAVIKDEVNASHIAKESPFHKCPECKSSIADKFVKKVNGPVSTMSIRDARNFKTVDEFIERYQGSALPSCPLCQSTLCGETVKAKLTKKIEKLFEAGNDVRETSEKLIALRKDVEEGLVKKMKLEDSFGWLVVGIAAS